MSDDRDRPTGQPTDHRVQVLVVGAGPVGLTAAHELARRGVDVRLVDKAAGPAVTSRALATHARTMEMYHQMGVLDRILPVGQRVEHFTVHQRGRALVRFDTNYSSLPTRYPFSLMVDQIITERVLRECVLERGVKIEWSTELVDFVQADDHVVASLRHADGSVETVTASWLVGVDGARSVVRKRLGLRLLGDSAETWLNADVLLDVDLPRDSNHLVHTGKGALLLVPFPDPGKWRIVDTVDVDRADEPEVVRQRLADKLSRALRRTVRVSTPTWTSAFAVQQRMIQRMRVGRCFVAGDAAHVHSPASGQGMNTGMQDAYNLAWKLADVVRGHATQDLLDSYDAERVPIGRTLLKSTGTATALVALRDSLAPVLMPVGLGVVNALGPLKRRIEGKIVRGFCALALEYANSPLALDSGGRRTGVRPGQRVGWSLAESSSPVWRDLATELRDPRWTLLGVPGPSDPDGPVTFALNQVDRQFGAAVSVRTVTSGTDPRAGHRVLGDPDGELRRRIGVRAGDFALVRPDGYLAAKGPVARLAEALTALHLNVRPVAVPDRAGTSEPS
ncbi:MAG: FAD-dependent oxidoreductase [Actinocatenispora sp.]